MARRFYNRIRTGVAGWSYDDWAGVAYPEPKPRGFDPLGYLSGFLDLIEVNSTFYGPPEPEHATRWVEVVADRPRFRFTAKLWRRFTHDRERAWSRSDVRKVSDGIAPLLREGRLDALLAQFPWSFRNDETNREWLEDLTAAFPEFPLVVEVRHASWNDPDFYEWLAERGVGFVNIDQPLFSRSIAPSARVTSRIGYIRVHGRNYGDWFRKGAGRNARYDYLYSRDELERWAERARDVAREDGVDTVDVVFNNHYNAQAVVNALEYRAILGDPHVEAPPPLMASYRHRLRALEIPTPRAA